MLNDVCHLDHQYPLAWEPYEVVSWFSAPPSISYSYHHQSQIHAKRLRFQASFASDRCLCKSFCSFFNTHWPQSHHVIQSFICLWGLSGTHHVAARQGTVKYNMSFSRMPSDVVQSLFSRVQSCSIHVQSVFNHCSIMLSVFNPCAIGVQSLFNCL